MSMHPWSTLIVVIPWYSEHDAISNDAYWQQQLLKQAGNKALLYAEGFSPHLADRLISYSELEVAIADPDAILMYHHGVYWVQGEQIINSAKCKIILKYHNITPPEFYRAYDRPSTFATEKGREQTARFLSSQRFHSVLADSQYNIADLESYGMGLPRSSVAAPFTQIQDFDAVDSDNGLAADLQDSDVVHILFVGRVVPNKGHTHLIKVLDRYIALFGGKVRLHIVGGIAMSEDTYFRELEDLINFHKLGQHIVFHQKVNLSDIKALYTHSDVFLLMSEHEGFCVPILESQYLSLPIVALDKGAVAETLGEEQLVLSGVDYTIFACAVHRVATDKALRERLIASGQKNRARFLPDIILQKTIECLDHL